MAATSGLRARGAGPADEATERGGSYAGPNVYLAAGLALVAALIHLWVVPEHLGEWWAHGAFFLVVGLAQGLGTVLLLRWPERLLFVAGIWGNLAVISLYVVSRTSGVPFGPHAGVPEEAGALDMTATAAELGLVVALVTLLEGSLRRRTMNALLLLGALAWVARMSGIL